ncbi:hypothetical protein L3V79_08180 [Thiotrichales bacterium 19S9-12]|nr:hypothetical protein [Thiotrichales bacterium 19S9-11]MCF6812330.1 hypothetical protein [Thiotrichales bacterium 19S9-12]
MPPFFKKIAIVKEIESPENPKGLERRVVMIPSDVGALVKVGADVYVEAGAGLNMGHSDDEYTACGAVIQSADQIYQDKDLIIKFKGPSMESINQMKPGCTLFCMAHFHSYPERALLLEKNKINVIAMEEILESPKKEPDEDILSRLAMKDFIAEYVDLGKMDKVNLHIFQWTKRLRGAIRRASNRDPKSLRIFNDSVNIKDFEGIDQNSLFFYDSQTFNQPNQIALIEDLKAQGAIVADLVDFEERHGQSVIEAYRSSHKPFTFGKRRIQCLHETGQAGARYGLKLLEEKSNKEAKDVVAVVLGFGNVGQGAIDELYQQNVKAIHVLGRKHTDKAMIEKWLSRADLIVNGAEQAQELRGVNYLITNEHVKDVIKDGSVIVDLVGGSPTNRSPVEPVLSCTFLTDPYFEQDGVYISAIWGWPMLGVEKESTIRYSGQILDVLINEEKLINGLNPSKQGLQRALVCGPFDA